MAASSTFLISLPVAIVYHSLSVHCICNLSLRSKRVVWGGSAAAGAAVPQPLPHGMLGRHAGRFNELHSRPKRRPAVARAQESVLPDARHGQRAPGPKR